MTAGNIQAHLAEMYGTAISMDTICRITGAIVEDIVAWQHRPLDRVYQVRLIDASVVKIRDSQVANRPISAEVVVAAASQGDPGQGSVVGG